MRQSYNGADGAARRATTATTGLPEWAAMVTVRLCVIKRESMDNREIAVM